MLGGMPAIAGARLAVRSIIGRFEDGDFVDHQQEDCPESAREAFMAAELHAKARLPQCLSSNFATSRR
ncbi:MAG: DUF433 domain-containing protein [Boseongicola sp.]|nr:DUF433 domain-containing protein [Boseongicola sp.]